MWSFGHSFRVAFNPSHPHPIEKAIHRKTVYYAGFHHLLLTGLTDVLIQNPAPRCASLCQYQKACYVRFVSTFQVLQPKLASRENARCLTCHKRLPRKPASTDIQSIATSLHTSTSSLCRTVRPPTSHMRFLVHLVGRLSTFR